MSTWPARWRAHWIWFERADIEGAFVRGEAPPRPRDGFGSFRRAFTLTDVPARVPARVTCDGRYALSVNGQAVARGPVRSQPWMLTYDEVDLAPLLRTGENAIGVLARHYGGPTVHWQPARPVGALGYGSLLFEAELDGDVLVSDERWRARVAPYERIAHAEGPPPPEVLDARAWPDGWDEAGFDDADWAAALVVDPDLSDPRPPTEPFAVLAPRPIAPLAETVLEPASGDDGVHDFGGVVNAHPVLSITAETDAVIEVRAGEDLLDGVPVMDVRDWRMRITVPAGARRVESFEPAGFRYLRTSVTEGRARVEVAARERIYPREPGARFDCSDPALTAIWLAGLRTVDACSSDAYLDCPGREQRAWLSDSYGHSLVSLLTNPDTRLVRWMLRLHANGRRPDGLLPMVAAGDFGLRAETLPDNNLIWILALDLVWRRTGDAALLADLLPVATGICDYFEGRRGRDGLIADLPGWIFIDWAQVQRGRSIAVIDALYALAARTCAALATAASDERLATIMTARATRTAEAFEAYFDAGRGAYVDALDGDGERKQRVSQHANAMAILGGCAPRARWDAMLDAVLDPSRLVRTRTPADPGDLGERVRSPELEPAGFDAARGVVLAQPFFSHFVHRAVIEAGRLGALNDLLRRWSAMVERGGTTLPEYWDAPPGRASLCHAWSAVPVHDLMTNVLGIQAEHDRIVIRPHLGDLAWAEGTAASAHGWIAARFEAGGGGWVETPAPATLVIDGRERALAPGRTVLEPVRD